MFVNNIRLGVLLSTAPSLLVLPRRCILTRTSDGSKSSCARLLFPTPHSHWKIPFRGNAHRSRTKLTPDVDALGGAHEGNGMYRSKLMRPFFFTVGFGCCSFAGAAIWQYENFRRFASSTWSRPAIWPHDPYGSTRSSGFNSPTQMLKQWWRNLSEGQRIALAIIGLNGLVFVAWRIPVIQPAMIKWFASNPAARVVCWPMLLSTFSHYSFWHYGINMYVLYSFSTGIVAALGKEQFVAVYLSAGLVSSFTSYLHKVIAVRPGLSLGASGCLMGVLGFFCTQYPTAKLAIVFLPMFTFTADMALKGVLILDGLGVLLGWKFFDHAAHLGGALFGIFYAKWGREYIWAKREPLVLWWNKMRGKPFK